MELFQLFSNAVTAFLKANNYPALLPKAFFFDMDGILFDSMPRHARAWHIVMKEQNIEFSEYDAFLNEGKTGRSVINDAFLSKYGREATADEIQMIYSRKSQLFDSYGMPTPIEGVAAILGLLKTQDVQIFVVTGSGQPSLLDNLQCYFPDVFQQAKMITAFDVKKGKPDPEPYLMALEKSGVKPWEAVVIENAPLGVQSAHAAGLFTFGINTGILKPEDLSTKGADVVLDNMAQLLSLLEQETLLF